MSTKRKTANDKSKPLSRSEHDDSESVTAYLSELKHPLKPVIEAIRAAILGADKSITEGIKWNTASFYCHGWFATVGVRPKVGVHVVLHHGAKVRAGSSLRTTIDDSSDLLKWLAHDRAIITFASTDDFKKRQPAFKQIIKQWAQHQKRLAKEV